MSTIAPKLEPTAADLEGELTQLQERRATLTGQLQDAQQALDAAHRDLIAGTAEVSKLEGAQTRISALQGGISTLDGTIGALRSRLETAQAEERRVAV